MQIERTNGPELPGIQDGVRGAAKPGARPRDGADAAAGPDDAALRAEAETLAVKARKAPEINQDAVAETRRLLAAGQLATPDAIRRAAQTILRDGI